ncbi:HNH endonuclease [Escherichia coli]|uniref:HNH endonuclease n=1 Tax=Escherichia coli TaxID=562 RepID=UPI000DD61FA5|nr:HNH endonuclease [Escherichia coli]
MGKRYESDTFRTRLYDHYIFDPTIPELLRVKTPYGKSKRAVGEPVSFSMSPKGYASVSVLGKYYRRSRVIYSLCKGRIPDGCVVDHIDGNRLNDHPDNLRVCTYQENRWNADSPGGKRQNYLPKGISYYATTDQYRAMLRLGGRYYTRSSPSVSDLILFLHELRQEHHKEYAFDGWTEWSEDDQMAADIKYQTGPVIGRVLTGGKPSRVRLNRATGQMYRLAADGKRLPVAESDFIRL